VCSTSAITTLLVDHVYGIQSVVGSTKEPSAGSPGPLIGMCAICVSMNRVICHASCAVAAPESTVW
jgi:hypothetical protein